MKNTAKEKMMRGENILGTFFELGGQSAMECIGSSGMDFVIIDMEHGPFDKETCVDLIRAAELAGTTPFVRIADVAHGDIQKAVDAGACGIIAPCVRTKEEVKQLVDYAKFTPVGKRGYAPVRSDVWGAAPYAADGIEKYMRYCNEQVLVLPQCETCECLEKIEEIVAIDGVDGIFVGPFDLSISLGKPARFDDPVVAGAIERIVKACRDAGKFAFIFVGNAKVCRERFQQGFNAAAYGMDTLVLIDAYKNIVAELKGGK